MRLKLGATRASIVGVRPEILFAVLVVEDVYRSTLVPEDARVITSGTDGEHVPGSRHYLGAALDFATHGIPTADLDAFAQRVSDQLGPDYHVLLEYRATPDEHLHVELHPDSPIPRP